MRRFSLSLLALLLAIAPVSAGANETVTAAAIPLRQLVSGLSLLCKREIVADPAVAALIVSLPTTPVNCGEWLTALDSRYHIHPEVEGNVLLIVPDDMSATSQVYSFTYGDASTVAEELRASTLSSQGLTVLSNSTANTITLAGPNAVVLSALQVVQKQDVPPPAGIELTYPLKYMDTTDAQSELAGMFASGSYGHVTVTPKPEIDALLITGSPGALSLASKWLSKDIDVPIPEVALKVAVWDLTPQNDYTDLGALLGGVAPGGSTSGTLTVTPNQLFTPFVNKSVQVNATVNTLIQHGRARELAHPLVLVRSGKAIPIHIGAIQPIVSNNGGFIGGNTVSQLDTGITLTATPIAGENGRVHMTLSVSYSEVTGYNQGYPIVNARSVASTLDVNADQTITFGGLTDDNSSVTDTKIPILGDIPIFGRFFHNYQTNHLREEVVFQVTPCVVRPDTATTNAPQCMSYLEGVTKQ